MRRLFLGLSLAVLVSAKPELYREKEDFQYSRSSSDEGSKSGYYDAQRGNMGGNYERAHNMDTLAQHQLGGLIKQVQGELGDGSRTRSGNVYTSANTQGVYGSGRYDLSALGNRNFQDGTTYEGAQMYSSSGNKAYESHSTSQNNARYSTNSQSHDSGFNGFQSGHLQEAQNAYSAGRYAQDSQSDLNARLYSGYQGRSEYEKSNLRHHDAGNFGADNRQSQVRIVLTPGSRVVVPVNAQVVHSGARTASLYDRTENSEAEALNNDDQQIAYTSNNKPKHYESSYSYRKQWEKHDTKPVTLYTVGTNPISVNSELYDSGLHRGSHYENENVGQLATQARQQAFNSQQQMESSSHLRNQAEFNSRQTSALSNSNTFSQNGNNLDAESGNSFAAIGSKPKSYQSSYSYHKSWERQGDPYIIKPAYNGQTSESLTDLAAAVNHNSFQNYGSTLSKSHQARSSVRNCVSECDPQISHYRAVRSASAYDTQETQQSQNAWQQYDLGQQTQNAWNSLENLGQQTHQTSGRLEDLGQQTQNKWDQLENLDQQTQDFGQQQSQDFVQQLQGVGQETEHTFGKVQDFGQQTQNKWDHLENLDQQTQDFGSQTEHKFDQVENLGQQTQNNWDHLENFGSQTQDIGQQTQDFGQQTQDLGQQTQDFGQETQGFGQQLQDLGQQTQDFGQETQDFGQQLQDLGQQTQDFGQETHDFGQQLQDAGQQVQNTEQETQNTWNNLHGFGQQSESLDEPKPADLDKQENVEIFNPEEIDNGQQTHKAWKPMEDQNTQDINKGMQQNTQSFWDQINTMEQSHDSSDQHHKESSVQNEFQEENTDQQTQGVWNNINTDSYHSFTFNRPAGGKNPLNNLWDKIDNLDSDNIGYKQNDVGLYNDFSNDTSVSNSSVFNISFDDIATNKKEKSDVSQTNIMSGNKLHEQSSTTQKEITSTEKIEKHQSNDLGRGDIGPEDIFDDVTSTTDNSFNTFKDIQTNEFHGTQDKHDKEKSEGNIITSQITDSNLNTLHSTNLVEQSVHKVQVEETPEIENQFLSHNTQKLETFVNNHNYFNHASHDQGEQNRESFGKEEGWLSQQSQNQHFQHVSDQSSQNTFEQRQSSHHEHGFQQEQGFQNGQGFQQGQVFHQGQDFHQGQGFHHGQGFHQEQGFHKELGSHDKQDFHQGQGLHKAQGLQHEHGFHQEQRFHHEHGFHREHSFHHEQVSQQNEFTHQTDFTNTPIWDHGDKFREDANDHKLDWLNSGFEQVQSQIYQHDTEQQAVDLEQQHNKWNEEQQNVHQLNVDFSQQNTQNQFEQENINDFEDFGQKDSKIESLDKVPAELKQGQQKEIETLDMLQTNEGTFRNANQRSYNSHTENMGENTFKIPHQLNEDAILIERQQTSLAAVTQKSIPMVKITEKPGFWKSVGQTFSSAKSKVSSWFGS